MPFEMRTIVFSREELVEAITNQAAVAGVKLPEGAIMLCTVAASPTLTVTLELVPKGQSSVETVTLQAEAIGAVLIHHCIAQKIPVPRQSERSLQAIGEAVAIHFTINKQTVKLPAFA